MGRALLSTFLADLVDRTERMAFQTKHSMVKPLQKVMLTLLILDDAVDDAEEKHFRGGSYAQQVKDWLNEVQDALYQLDELLPGCWIPFSRGIKKRKAKAGKKFKAQILDILENLESLLIKIGVLGLTVKPATKRWMESSGGLYSTSTLLDNYPKDDDFFVRNAEVESILDYLLSTPAESEEHIRVINIMGLPGVSKTTLANVVFSNHKVTESFEITAKLSVPHTATANWMVKNILEACHKLASLPLVRLAHSLSHLTIRACPLLKVHCEKDISYIHIYIAY